MIKRLCFALAGAFLLTASLSAPAHAAPDSAPAPAYYLSLGDSLAQGVQPNSSGVSVETNQGYVDDLYAAERTQVHNLRLAKLGCPGETTGTMLKGGICPYTSGSQVGDAVAFLRTHRVAFVTIDIGANDLDSCLTPTGIDLVCVAAGLKAIGTNLPQIMAALRAAAPDVPVYAMTYYDPFLGLWVLGGSFQQLALSSLPLTTALNHLLTGIYRHYDARMANVARAFETFNTTLVAPGIPTDVLRVCENTWMCVPPPVGPNIHANPVGYGIIAATFAAEIGRL